MKYLHEYTLHGPLTERRGSPRNVEEWRLVADQYAAEIERLRAQIAGLKDPATVWVNMLRGEIARPRALDHYEELKAEVERLQAEVALLRAEIERPGQIRKCPSCDTWVSAIAVDCPFCKALPTKDEGGQVRPHRSGGATAPKEEP